MKTLKISEEKALQLYPTADAQMKAIFEESFGIDFFKPRKITDIITCVDALLAHLGIEEEEFLPYWKETKSRRLTAVERSLNAQAWMFKIAEALNEGTKLDWKNKNQGKYLAYKYWSGGRWVVLYGGWDHSVHSPSGLYLKSGELALFAQKTFPEIHDDYWMIQEFMSSDRVPATH